MYRMIIPAGRLTALLLLAALSLPALSQGKVVTGTVSDHRNVPIVGVRVCQTGSTNCTSSDMSGMFHLALDPEIESMITVTCPGFISAEVRIAETTEFPVRVKLIPMYLEAENWADDTEFVPGKNIITRSSIGYDAILTDFTEFTGLLGSHNTEAMDYFAVAGPEIGASFSRIYTGLGIGMGYNYKEDYDTLVVDLKNTLFKLSLGYDIISSRRIRMTPMISLRLMKSRLRNYSGESRVKLEDYLREKETDLRFNQAMAVAGLNLEYLMYSGNRGMSDYWSIGLFGGYTVKLNRKPWIRSDGNHITTDSAISLNPLTAGISISYYSSPKSDY
ncbi:MAG TPA: hypothetical protein DIS74_11100 [Bacteroidales bacterium]|nr:hypothetical protein [Bacteroidales bacterium]